MGDAHWPEQETDSEEEKVDNASTMATVVLGGQREGGDNGDGADQKG